MSDTEEQAAIQVNVWMTAELRDEIDALATRLDINRSQLIRRACRELLVRLSGRLTNVSSDTPVEEVAS